MFAVLIDQFWSLTIAGIALGFIYVLVSLGYTMVYGVLRMINFANSEIFMWGTFGAVISNRDLFNYTQTSEPATGFKLLVVLFTGLLISMFIAALTAVFVEFVAYRRLRMRGTNRLATLISAIGVSIALAEVMRLLTDSRPVGSPRVLEKIILNSSTALINEPSENRYLYNKLIRRNYSYTHNYGRLITQIIGNRTDFLYQTFNMSHKVWKPKYGMPKVHIIKKIDTI